MNLSIFASDTFFYYRKPLVFTLIQFSIMIFTNHITTTTATRIDVNYSCSENEKLRDMTTKHSEPNNPPLHTLLYIITAVLAHYCALLLKRWESFVNDVYLMIQGTRISRWSTFYRTKLSLVYQKFFRLRRSEDPGKSGANFLCRQCFPFDSFLMLSHVLFSNFET